ncbi:MAG: hypothetical protein N2556_07725, partial [Anaerolineae bacterium]|nr:hypothetical protein [Anaerolineae bacterium]
MWSGLSGFSLRRLLIGSPLATAQLKHERLTKIKALAVFASDALSSTAYATEEILLVLILAGSGAVGLAWPIALGIATLLAHQRHGFLSASNIHVGDNHLGTLPRIGQGDGTTNT